EKMEYPKPNRDFIYDTFNAFAAAHPWVGNENIRPKSIAREMYETFQSFDEYIRDYDQQRAEGLLLRYLTEVYKVLVQTVPESYRSEEVEAIIDYFGTMIRGIDSSLLDEWERMRNPNHISANDRADDAKREEEAPDVTREMRAFTVQIRNEVFRFIRALASRDYESALSIVEPSPAEDAPVWTPAAIDNALSPYFVDHHQILTDRQARHPSLCRVTATADGKGFKVEQTVTDPYDHNDWRILFSIDRARSRELGRPVLQLVEIGEMG
ncbi:MAG: DUF3516 domain-containing protein, partial [Proteobacteria bacterium]